MHPACPVAVNRCLLVRDRGAWLPAGRVCDALVLPQGCPARGSQVWSGLGHWVRVLNGSILDEEGPFSLLSHTVAGKESEGRLQLGVWDGVAFTRRCPQTGLAGMGAPFGRAESKGDNARGVWAAGGAQARPRGGPEIPDPGVSGVPRPHPQPRSDSSLASESFLSASHPCGGRGCQRALLKEQNVLLSCSKSINGCPLSAGYSGISKRKAQSSCGRLCRAESRESTRVWKAVGRGRWWQLRRSQESLCAHYLCKLCTNQTAKHGKGEPQIGGQLKSKSGQVGNVEKTQAGVVTG